MHTFNGKLDCAVLIPSCDKYADLWHPFLTLFWRHWPDCPFPVWLGSNEAAFDDPRVRTVRVGEDRSWSEDMRLMLEAIPAPYILILLEDFFLRRTVDTPKLLRLVTALDDQGGHMLRLYPNPGPDRHVAEYPEIGALDGEAPYRVCLQAAIWRRESLNWLLVPGESAWQFESGASLRSAALGEGFYCVWNRAIEYGHHVVEHGCWFRSSARQFGRMGIGCDFSRRPIMTRCESLKWNIRKTRSRALMMIPWKRRLQLVGWVRRLKGKPRKEHWV